MDDLTLGQVIYRENYLRDKTSNWQHIKDQYWTGNYKRRCFVCGGFGPLVLHHRHYETIGFEVLFKDVIPVCKPCHQDIHFVLWIKIPLTRYWLRSSEVCLWIKKRIVHRFFEICIDITLSAWKTYKIKERKKNRTFY